MGILGFIVLGLVVGGFVKVLLRGRAVGGWPPNLALGVLGAILGGGLGSVLFGVSLGTFFDPRTSLLAIVAGFFVALIYGDRGNADPGHRRPGGG